jgi:hypothetical protein
MKNKNKKVISEEVKRPKSIVVSESQLERLIQKLSK